MNGYECLDCGYAEATGNGASDVDCLGCGGTNTIGRRIEPCAKGNACDDDSHHYGLGLHVAE